MNSNNGLSPEEIFVRNQIRHEIKIHDKIHLKGSESLPESGLVFLNGYVVTNDLMQIGEGLFVIKNSSDELFVIDEYGEFFDDINPNEKIGVVSDGMIKVHEFNGGMDWLNIKDNYTGTAHTEYDAGYDFVNGFAKVGLEQKGTMRYNWIDKNGSELSEVWYSYAGDFHEGLATIGISNNEGKTACTRVDRDGIRQNFGIFEYTGNFINGYAIVGKRQELGMLYNYIDKAGKIIFKKRFNSFDPGLLRFNEGYFVVDSGFSKYDEYSFDYGYCNYANKDGKCLLNKRQDMCIAFKEGMGIVKKDLQFNIINKSGKSISSDWFEWCGNVGEGWAVVKNRQGSWLKSIFGNPNHGGGFNFINLKGEYLLKNRLQFDSVGRFSEGFALVKNNGAINWMKKDGTYLFQNWFEGSEGKDFKDGLAQIMRNQQGIKTRNFVNKQGELIFKN